MTESARHLAIQGMAFYNAGVFDAAYTVLSTAFERSSDGFERCKLLAPLIDMADESADLRRFDGIVDSCRAWVVRASEDAASSRYSVAALRWSAAARARAAGDEAEFWQLYQDARHRVTELSSVDRPHVALLYGFQKTMIGPLIESRDSRHTREAKLLLDQMSVTEPSRASIEPSLACDLYCYRANVLQRDVATFHEARSLSEAARGIAVQASLPRALWASLYLSIIDALVCDDVHRALLYAGELYAATLTTDHARWQALARNWLAKAYLQANRVHEAAAVIEPVVNGPHRLPQYALIFSRILQRRGELARALVILDEAAVTFVQARQYFYVSQALSLKAKSLLELDRPSDAERAIEEALSIANDCGMTTLLAQSELYDVASKITRRADHVRTARDIEAAMASLRTAKRPTGRGAPLTKRQRAVAELAASGATNRAIANHLSISHRTVAHHLSQAFAALGIRARWQLSDAIDKFGATPSAQRCHQSTEPMPETWSNPGMAQ